MTLPTALTLREEYIPLLHQYQTLAIRMGKEVMNAIMSFIYLRSHYIILLIPDRSSSPSVDPRMK